MNRAAVIIAVKKAGTLPELKAAIDGAKTIATWADRQGFDPVVTITDEQNPVTAKQIKTAIKALVESDSYDQLFVYFAGHGVNLHYSEFWLLSDAPEDTQEAVNVASSVQLAKRCGIPHVVILSDACRTAPEGIQAQAIRGSEIFPNQGRGGPQKAVDVFYASLLGEPALEIQDKSVSALRYESLYTAELVSALRGDRRTILSPDPADRTKVYLRPQPLKRHLTSEVPKLVASRLGPAAKHSQTPDAEILSDEFAFLQVFDAAEKPAEPPDAGARPARPPSPSLSEIAASAVQQALRSPGGAGGRAVATALRSNVTGAREISDAVRREGESFLAMHYETDCGFKVRGAQMARVSAAANVRVHQFNPELVNVDVQPRRAVNVLIELTDGRAVMLPALQNFIATLTFERDELRAVSYEPSDRSVLWPDYELNREELTALRALIAASVHMGTFRLEMADAAKMTERIRFQKALDPTMALYAAYSYHRLGKPELIQDMEQYVVRDLGITIFDIALLADRDPNQSISREVFPFLPMLAQGWSLLGAFEAWTPLLEALRPHVANSLWTLFKSEAVPMLRNALKG